MIAEVVVVRPRGRAPSTNILIPSARALNVDIVHGISPYRIFHILRLYRCSIDRNIITCLGACSHLTDSTTAA